MIQVPLGGRRAPIRGFALVDDDDAWIMDERFWSLAQSGYAVSCRPTFVSMHRRLLAPPEGMEVDHINGDGLDNRRCNLRVVTHAQNQQNQRTAKGAYRGVYFNRQRGTWYGRVKLAGRAYETPARHDRDEVRRDVERLRDKLLPYSVPERLGTVPL